MFLKAILFAYTLASSKTCIHTFTFSPFLMMTTIILSIFVILSSKYFCHHQNLHDSHSLLFLWWQPSSYLSLCFHQVNTFGIIKTYMIHRMMISACGILTMEQVNTCSVAKRNFLSLKKMWREMFPLVILPRWKSKGKVLF